MASLYSDAHRALQEEFGTTRLAVRLDEDWVHESIQPEEGAFIGSNASLVAPVTVGRGAYVASGSAVTEDVPEDALAIGRARQTTKAGRAKVLRAERAAAKAARKG